MEIKINERESLDKKRMIAFELPQLWYEELKRCADEEMISISNLLRIIIYKNYLSDKLTERNSD